MLYIENHIVDKLLWLTFFAQHTALKIQSERKGAGEGGTREGTRGKYDQSPLYACIKWHSETHDFMQLIYTNKKALKLGMVARSCYPRLAWAKSDNQSEKGWRYSKGETQNSKYQSCKKKKVKNKDPSILQCI
jgi:hypothetical protein